MVAQDEPHVSVGGLLEAGQRLKRKMKACFGKKECIRKVTARRKHNTRACKESNN
jgi:hypothetical protein